MHREILGEPLRVLCVSVVKVLLIQTETAIFLYRTKKMPSDAVTLACALGTCVLVN
jgi:hypothetical protein